MTIRRNVITTAALLASASMIPLAAPAQAQDAQASGDQARDVITVTARRREETIQDVPVAVTAIGGGQLEELGAEDITFVGQVVPNVTLETSRATNTTLTAFIRGVGQQDPVAGFEQGVGIYLDDVYLNRPQAAVLDIYDVERIEVLRGPQGTLYGRNTIGGAVKYVTRGLSDEPTLSARVSLGSYSQRDAVITASTPLSDAVRIGGSIARLTRDGFGDNRFTGEDNYNKDILAFRGSAEFDLGPNFDLRFSADYIDDQSAPRHGYRVLPSLVTGAQPLDDRFDTEGGVAGFSPFSENSVEAFGYSAQAEWRVNDRVTLKSITAYREDESESLIDFDSTPLPTFDAWVVYDNDQFSQEFQLLYEGDRLNVVGGFYYLDANAFNAFDVFFTVATQLTLGDVNTEAWALFGEATYDLTDRLSLTVGGRYTEDERTAEVTTGALFLGQGSPYFFNRPDIIPAPFVGTRTDDAFTPRVILAFDATDELNLYASYSEGFKGGLFDPRGNFAIPEIQDGVNPETVESYEIGLKGQFLDGRLQTNAAIFMADYTDVQIPGSEIIQLPGGGTTFEGTLTNAGAAEFTGVELEATAFLTESLTAFVSLGYVDAEYTVFEENGVNIADQVAVQNTPDWTGNFRLNHTSPLSLFGNAGSLALNGSASYRGDSQQFEFANPLLDQDAFWMVDASAAWTSDSGRFSAGLHGRNLFDEEYITSGYDFGTVDNSVLAFYGNPRTVTATVTVRY